MVKMDKMQLEQAAVAAVCLHTYMGGSDTSLLYTDFCYVCDTWCSITNTVKVVLLPPSLE